MLGKEPTVILGAGSEVIRQVIPTLIIFGIINWTAEQTAAVNILTGVVVGFLNVVLTRSQTVSTEVANRQIEIAVTKPIGTNVAEVVREAKDEAKDEAKN